MNKIKPLKIIAFILGVYFLGITIYNYNSIPKYYQMQEREIISTKDHYYSLSEQRITDSKTIKRKWSLFSGVVKENISVELKDKTFEVNKNFGKVRIIIIEKNSKKKIKDEILKTKHSMYQLEKGDYDIYLVGELFRGNIVYYRDALK